MAWETNPAMFHSLPCPAPQLALASVLRSGQSFRWAILPLPHDHPSGAPHEYRLCLRDRVVCLRQAADTLHYRTAYPDPQPTPAQLALRDAQTLAWIKDYFQLDIDLVHLYEQWAARDTAFAQFQGRFPGIRILRQDPWENLVSFVSLFLSNDLYANVPPGSSARRTIIFLA